tara:strand:- start:625 stop:828 length:204 start_codon:yes stop_codon:yes gene_type:complete
MSSETTKIKTFDRYIMRGGDLTLEQIEILVKENLGLGKMPSQIFKQEVFDEFMTLVIEQLTNLPKEK